MFEEILRQMRKLIRLGKLQVTPHAFTEMQNDSLFIFDVEQCILTGQIVEQQRDLVLEQWKYIIHGISSDGEPMAVVAKLDAKHRVFIITTYTL